MYALLGEMTVEIDFDPSEKGSTLKGKNLLPVGRPFRTDPFSEEAWFEGKPVA